MEKLKEYAFGKSNISNSAVWKVNKYTSEHNTHSRSAKRFFLGKTKVFTLFFTSLQEFNSKNNCPISEIRFKLTLKGPIK